MADLVRLITATEPAVRNQSLEAACAGRSLSDLLEQCAALDAFRRRSENLYERVRALFFLYAIHRFHLPARMATRAGESGMTAKIPFKARRKPAIVAISNAPWASKKPSPST